MVAGERDGGGAGGGEAAGAADHAIVEQGADAVENHASGVEHRARAQHAGRAAACLQRAGGGDEPVAGVGGVVAGDTHRAASASGGGDAQPARPRERRVDDEGAAGVDGVEGRVARDHAGGRLEGEGDRGCVVGDPAAAQSEGTHGERAAIVAAEQETAAGADGERVSGEGEIGGGAGGRAQYMGTGGVVGKIARSQAV